MSWTFMGNRPYLWGSTATGRRANRVEEVPTRSSARVVVEGAGQVSTNTRSENGASRPVIDCIITVMMQSITGRDAPFSERVFVDTCPAPSTTTLAEERVGTSSTRFARRPVAVDPQR